MDTNLAYMYKMIEKTKISKDGLGLNKQALAEYGAKVKLFKGVKHGLNAFVIMEKNIISL